jgi:hypothetical protein
MGILDDAIREHLELKRKHGVPEEEVERQEEEALGPARREVAQQPEDAEIAAQRAAGDAGLFDGEHPGTPVAEHEAVLPEPPAQEAQSEEPVATEPAPDEPLAAPAEPPVADHTGMEPPPADDLAAAEPSAPASRDRERIAREDTEPHGFPAVEDEEEPDEGEDFLAPDDADEDEAGAADEGDDEELDVLEDTPDFLQETPEHDRLWFEQKPPRDFDFD